MAGAVEILLKLIGDGSSAIKAFRDTTDAAKGTETQVDRTVGKLRGMASSLGDTLRGAGGTLSGLKGDIEALSAAWDDLSGNTARRRELDADIARASNLQDLGRATQRRVESTLDPGFTLFPSKDSPQVKAQAQLAKILDAMSTAAATIVVSQLTGDVKDLGSAYLANRRQLEAGAAFRSGLGAPTVQNITINLPAGTDPRLAAQLQRDYGRVNGQGG